MNKEKALKNQGLEFREDMCVWGVQHDSYLNSITFIEIG